MNRIIDPIVDGYKDRAVEWRRDFHKYAEPGWLEFRTTSRIVEILTAEGIPVLYGPATVDPQYAWSYPADRIPAETERAIAQGANPEIVAAMQGYTGAVAVIDTGKPGKTYALRFDIDALGVSEQQSGSHLPHLGGFASVNENVMHACGHDGHAAMGLVVAISLNRMKDQLTGRYKVIFQPGEEGCRGGQAVAESGLLDDVDVFLSGHLGLGLPTGTFAVFNEGFLASTKFDLIFEGRSAHAGASPQEGHNAILAASSAILAMYSLCQDGRGTTRLNVGTICGGTGRNVIADRAQIQMETRGTDNEIEQRLFHACLSAAQGAAQMYGCTVRHEIRGYAPAFLCDRELEAAIRTGAQKVAEIGSILPVLQATGSEDVGYLMKKVRERGGTAAYMGIGSTSPAPHHSIDFDLDEASILHGAKVYLHTLLELQE